MYNLRLHEFLRERVVPIGNREIEMQGNKRMQIYRSNHSKENMFRFLLPAKDSQVSGRECLSRSTIYRLGENICFR